MSKKFYRAEPFKSKYFLFCKNCEVEVVRWDPKKILPKTKNVVKIIQL